MRPTPARSPPAATAITTASSDQPSTSSTTAQAIASTPSGVRCMRRSLRIRASTGIAVIDIATPMNTTNATGDTDRPATVSCSGYNRTATPAPRPNGSTIEAAAIIPAARSRPRMSDRSTSRPTMNMNSTSPSWATTVRYPRTGTGNSAVSR